MRKIYRVISRIVRVSFSSAPGWLSLSLLAGSIHGVLNGLITFRLQDLFDILAQYGDRSVYENGVREIVEAVVLLVVCVALYHIAMAVHNGTIEDISFRIMRKMHIELSHKVDNLNPVFFEKADNLTLLQKAQGGIEYGTFFFNVLSIIGTYYIPYFAFMALYLYSLRPVLILMIFLVFVPVMVIQLIKYSWYAKLVDHTAVYERRYRHYEDCLINKKYFKETRILGAFSYFFRLYKSNIEEYNTASIRVKKDAVRIESISQMINMAGYAGIVVLLISEVLTKQITIGAFVALLSSISTMFALMEELLCNHVGSLVENYSNIEAYVDFLDMPLKKNSDMDREETERFDIVADNISFVYPDAQGKALNHINLQIKEGEFIAIVGENGAGKTTLSKVLCGIYDPTEGEVRIGGVSVDKVSKKTVMKKVSAVFQKYQRYAMSVFDNVYLGDTKKVINHKAIRKKLDETGLKWKNEFDNKDMLLSREYGGIDLSGGEWQRVAIVRSMYKDSKIVLMDEPTAAVDPLEEMKIYKLLKQMAEGKTAILVTHRLGAARLADRILVMQGGKIVEEGVHEELVRKKGVYAEMCRIQKEMY